MKMLAKDVLPGMKSDYLNANFVAKYDMEKDADGVILKDRFGVKAFLP